jgi:hypothetical protein
MEQIVTISLETNSEQRTEFYSHNFDFDSDDFCIQDILTITCENLKKAFGINDDDVIKMLGSSKGFYELKRKAEHEENYPSMLRHKPKGN